MVTSSATQDELKFLRCELRKIMPYVYLSELEYAPMSNMNYSYTAYIKVYHYGVPTHFKVEYQITKQEIFDCLDDGVLVETREACKIALKVIDSLQLGKRKTFIQPKTMFPFNQFIKERFDKELYHLCPYLLIDYTIKQDCLYDSNMLIYRFNVQVYTYQGNGKIPICLEINQYDKSILNCKTDISTYCACETARRIIDYLFEDEEGSE